jgi:hypothetical protein
MCKKRKKQKIDRKNGKRVRVHVPKVPRSTIRKTQHRGGKK